MFFVHQTGALRRTGPAVRRFTACRSGYPTLYGVQVRLSDALRRAGPVSDSVDVKFGHGKTAHWARLIIFKPDVHYGSVTYCIALLTLCIQGIWLDGLI